MEELRRRAVFRTSLAGAAVMLVGTLGYMMIEKLSFLNALYMTTITVTTIGFKEVVPLSPAGRLFTIFMAFAGVGTIFLAGTEIAKAIVDTNIRRIIDKRRENSMIKLLSEHIIVCGHGRIGRAVTDSLRAEGTPFVVIDSDPEVCAMLAEENVAVIEGDSTREESLEAAGIRRASTFLACLGNDAEDVFSILLARQLNPSLKIIAVAREEESIARLRLAGAQTVINPYLLGGVRLALSATKPAVMEFIDASLLGGNLDLELAEIRIEEGSRLSRRTLAEARVRSEYGIIVVALKKSEESIFNPHAGVRIEEDDILIALGPPESLGRAAAAARSQGKG